MDTSALVAVIQREDGYEAIARILREAADLRMSAGSTIEAATVLGGRYAREGLETLFDLIRDSDITIVPVVDGDVDAAAEAYLRYGKGTGGKDKPNPAKLNFGDTFAYALAKRTGEPLLCTGDDFAQTDIPLVPLEPA